MDQEGWLRGYNQFCVTAIAEPIFRGVENHYFGSISARAIILCSRTSDSFLIFSAVSAWGGSTATQMCPGAQGQDFTFNILTAVGISYQLSERLENRRRHSLSASFEWRPNRSEPELEFVWAAGRTELFVLKIAGSDCGNICSRFCKRGHVSHSKTKRMNSRKKCARR